jgi:hypothetical protein
VELEQNEGGTFAGLWIQHEPAYRVRVAFNRDGEETIRPYVGGTPLAGLIKVRAATLMTLQPSAVFLGRVLEYNNLRRDVRIERLE